MGWPGVAPESGGASVTADRCHIVSWKKNGWRFLLDFNDEIQAQSVAIALAETGRVEVKVTAVEVEIDPEIKERIRQRLMQRMEELAWGVTA